MAKAYAAVVGAVNVDIWGRSFAPLLPRDSNPGEVRLSLGGVGRNIAHNLRLLDVPVQMLTVLGGDAWAGRIEESCRELGIGIDRALRVPGGRTSTYLYVTGPDGDMAVAVCDADIARYITPTVIAQNLDLLNAASLVVFDGNLTMEAMDFLTARCSAPLFTDPVSVAKAAKLVPFLSRIHTIKPNALEASALTGEQEPESAAKSLVRAGVRNVFVSDGARGMVAAQGDCCARFPCFPANPVNTNGCGDAAMAALCKSFLEGSSLPSAARYAMAAGALAVEHEETIYSGLSDRAIREKLNSMEEK